MQTAPTISDHTPTDSDDGAQQTLPALTSTPAARSSRRVPRRTDERGEGVISAAIAVLIMAFIGVGMWVAFNATFQHTAKNVDTQINKCIGQSNPSC